MTSYDPELGQPPLPANLLLDRLLGIEAVNPDAVQGVLDTWLTVLMLQAQPDCEPRPRWDVHGRTSRFVTEPQTYQSPLIEGEVTFRAKLCFGPTDMTEGDCGVMREMIILEQQVSVDSWAPFARVLGKGFQRPTVPDDRNVSTMWPQEVIDKQCPPALVIPGDLVVAQRDGSSEELFAFVDALERLAV